jgi:putative ABC transport system permease protein
MLADTRLAIRSLLARPTFTLLAVLALALGTGANSLVFSVVNAVLLRPLPYADADRVYAIQARGPAAEAEWEGLSAPDLRDLKAATRSFAAVGGIGFASFDLTGTDRPNQLRAALVTDGVFEAIGVRPLAGRVLSAEEIAAGAPVVVLDESSWRSQFTADPAIVGRSITLDGRPYTVVGVLPHLRFRDGQEYEMWTTVEPAELARQRRDQRGATVFARLRPGVDAAAARAELATIARRLAAQYPKENGGWTFRLESVRAWTVGALGPALLVLLGAVTLVLLIACTNVAHMLLARASQRGREVGIRAALGATRGRIVRQLLTESLVLALGGALAGLALAYLLLPALLRVAPLDDAQRAAVTIDLRVLGVALAAALTSTVLFGLWPAIVASRADLQGALKTDGARGATGRGGTRTRGALVVSEVAFASVLLVAAGLLLKSFEGLRRIDRGYDPAMVVSTGFVLPDNVYPKGADKREFMRRLLERLRATPGVEVAAAVNFPPRFGASDGEIAVGGRTETMSPEARRAVWRVATPDYFRALRIPLRRGRGIEEGDQPTGAKVAVVNETFAARFFPGRDPVGREVELSAFGPPQRLRIVGVVADVRHAGRTADVQPDLFLPYAQNSWGYMNLVVRGRQTTPAALLAAINRAVLAVDPARPTFSQGELITTAESDIVQPQFGAVLMSLFAGVAALLACIGIFGVMAYAVAARTREIGIRIALGGQPRSVLGLVLRPGLALVAAGAAAGVVAALAAGRVLASQLYGVEPSDPAVIAATVALLATVGAVACYVPARRATRVNPVTALRSG